MAQGVYKTLRSDEYALLQKISKAIDALLLEHYEMQKNISLITEANTISSAIPTSRKDWISKDTVTRKNSRLPTAG